MQQKIAFQKNQKSCWQPLKVMINYTSCRWNDNNKQKKNLKKLLTDKENYDKLFWLSKNDRNSWKRKNKKVVDERLQVRYNKQAVAKRQQTGTLIIEQQPSLKIQKIFSERTLLIRVIEANDFQNNSNGWMANVILTEQTLLTRVWSWLRMNAGGVPNTCKSSEAHCYESFGRKSEVT